MKNRKLLIVSFLVVAALVMGVGYAAVSGALGITGTATFEGTSLVNTDIYEALKFTKAEAGGDNCVASITNPEVGHAADMTVNFKDGIGEVGAVFVATATYTITYDTNDMALPDIHLTMPTPTITSNAEGFAITTNWTQDQTLSPGQSTTVVVTVTYTNQDPVVEQSVTGSIAVSIPFATVANSVETESETVAPTP